MKGEQLHLFDKAEQRAMAEIISFPVDREVAFIRETARVLMLKQGLSADRFWQMTCRRLYARLQVQGMAQIEIQEELRRFSNAVYAQLQMHAQAGSNNPRGAA